MKLEMEMTEEQLNLLILSTEIYGRILMNQPDLVADIIAEDRLFYDLERIWRDGQKVDISNMLIDEAN